MTACAGRERQLPCHMCSSSSFVQLARQPATGSNGQATKPPPGQPAVRVPAARPLGAGPPCRAHHWTTAHLEWPGGQVHLGDGLGEYLGAKPRALLAKSLRDLSTQDALQPGSTRQALMSAGRRQACGQAGVPLWHEKKKKKNAAAAAASAAANHPPNRRPCLGSQLI